MRHALCIGVVLGALAWASPAGAADYNGQVSIGYLFLAPYVQLVGAIMLFASGGILYLIFQDIAPQSALKRRWAPALGAVAGFAVGMIADLLTRAAQP